MDMLFMLAFYVVETIWIYVVYASLLVGLLLLVKKAKYLLAFVVVLMLILLTVLRSHIPTNGYVSLNGTKIKGYGLSVSGNYIGTTNANRCKEVDFNTHKLKEKYTYISHKFSRNDCAYNLEFPKEMFLNSCSWKLNYITLSIDTNRYKSTTIFIEELNDSRKKENSIDVVNDLASMEFLCKEDTSKSKGNTLSCAYSDTHFFNVKNFMQLDRLQVDIKKE